MSKKKNTLKDLDEFLKQQAATLVSPAKLSQQEEQPAPVQQESQATSDELSIDQIIASINYLSKSKQTEVRKVLYDLIIQATENLPDSLPEDKMLINTALYLKHGEQWKEEIRKYWKEK